MNIIESEDCKTEISKERAQCLTSNVLPRTVFQVLMIRLGTCRKRLAANNNVVYAVSKLYKYSSGLNIIVLNVRACSITVDTESFLDCSESKESSC